MNKKKFLVDFKEFFIPSNHLKHFLPNLEKYPNKIS